MQWLKKHFVLGTDLVLPSHMHHRNGNSSKRFVSHPFLLESLAPGPNHWGPHFSKDNNFIVKIHWQFFKFSPANPQGQFQHNLNKSILLQGGFKLVETKGHILFQWEMIATKWKYIDDLKFFSRTTGPISTYLCTNHCWVKRIQFVLKNKESSFSQNGDINFL